MLDSVLIWAVIAAVLGITGILSSLAGITEVAKQAFSMNHSQ